MPDHYDKLPVGSGGRKRERTIDSNVAAMATGTRPSSASAGSSPTPQRAPAQPSSFAPSGKRPENFTFGVPMHEDRVKADPGAMSERQRRLEETRRRRKEIYGYDPDQEGRK